MYVVNGNQINALSRFLDHVYPEELKSDFDDMFDSWVTGNDEIITIAEDRKRKVFHYRNLLRFLDEVKE